MAWDAAPGSPANKYVAAAQWGRFAQDLAERFPALAGRWEAFATSDELLNKPSIRYPPLFRAALGTMSGRKTKQGDGYDIAHLTRGLSRCDIVTADGGMTQVVRERRLAPAGCQLFAYREMDRLHHAVDTALASQ